MAYDPDLYSYPSLAEEAHAEWLAEQEAADEENRRADAAAEEDARERAFMPTETIHCDDDCFEHLAHSAACQAANAPAIAEPFAAAIDGFLRGQQAARTATVRRSA
jgi:hypothetical protein